MAEKDAFAERQRTFEEDYFRKKDRELIEKLRRAAEAEADRRAMGARTGLSDPALLAELQELGFTPETIVLLPIMPVLQMAWAEGGVTGAERTMIVTLARSRGVAVGSAADQQLGRWLTDRPSDDVFARATRLVRAMIGAEGPDASLAVTADDLVKHCEQIASTSGGILGIGRISAEERGLLASLAADLKERHG
jgi:hypothetical protein